MGDRASYVHAFYRAIDAGDWDGLASRVTEDFSCYVAPNAVVSEVRLESRAALRSWLGRTAGHEVAHRVRRIFEEGEHTVTFAEFSIGYDGRSATSTVIDVMRFDGTLIAENVRVVAE